MKKNDVIKWIYSQNQSGDFGFVDPLEWEVSWGKVKGYYVHFKNKKDVLDWDEVLAKVNVFKWREEAVILKVLKRTEKVLIWKFMKDKNGRFGFVVLKDNSIRKDIFIPWKFMGDSNDWDIVWVKIVKWDWKNPDWKIVEVIWKSWDKDIDVRGFILESGFREGFSEEVLNEIKDDIEIKDKRLKIKGRENLGKRKDLRWLFTFTIDWEDAKDLDDAISVKYYPENDWKQEYYKLFVHIADVAHYVRENSKVDREAVKRWTSVYLADRVLPMLPEALSNGLCSLNPDTSKLTLTCEMHISKWWELRKTIVYESIIESDFRLTYKEVDELISWDIKEGNMLSFWKVVNKELLDTIFSANDLKDRISKYREISWTLDFDFPEIKLEIDEEKNVKNIKRYPRFDSNKLIEIFMVSCNEAVSRKFFSYPFLYRIHEEPNFEDVEKLQNVLDLFWVKFRFNLGNTKEFSELLKLIWEKMQTSQKLFLENVILRTLAKAIYSSENLWHFGLWLKYYSHFTSPIRRYPDLQIHRIIKEKLSWGLDKKRICHYKTILEGIANSSSSQERKAEKLEYKVRDYYIVKHYKDRVWERFRAVIVSVIPVWFFVQLEDSVEWLVEAKDKYRIKEEVGVIEDIYSKKVYRLGDEVEVELVEADEERIRLNFWMV